MVEINPDPNAGGNRLQADDGRDEAGRLPEPLDAAHYPPTKDGPALDLPGMPLSQPAGTGPVVSSPVDVDEADHVADRDDSAAAQGGPDAAHDISGTPVPDGSTAAAEPPAPSGPGLRTDNTPTKRATAKKTG